MPVFASTASKVLHHHNTTPEKTRFRANNDTFKLRGLDRTRNNHPSCDVAMITNVTNLSIQKEFAVGQASAHQRLCEKLPLQSPERVTSPLVCQKPVHVRKSLSSETLQLFQHWMDQCLA